ncbi:hypothetical protein Hypma_015889 [Hypsizygus marmoreus]|uniref:Uncharacterized protein n=1 Tax=Hypsizygus marmoreus TaxID=39966 RepID=A0A369K4Y1_HYPMA|nr:hypothetical protein Hypma_015889 [Hypsizygus marmoreus]
MRNTDIQRIQNEILRDTPNYVEAFLVGDQCYGIPIVHVPPDVGQYKATKVDQLAFDIWLKPNGIYMDSLIDMTKRIKVVDTITSISGEVTKLSNRFTICYSNQHQHSRGMMNRLVKAVTGGCAWYGSLLVFKHGETGELVSVTFDDFKTAMEVMAW